MDEPAGAVHVIDDDEELLKSVRFLLEAHGIDVRTYGSAEEFLREPNPAPGCLLVDLRMPGLGGLGLIERLSAERRLPPTIVLTAHGDVPAAVRAMKLGATDFLSKPHDSRELLRMLRSALHAGVRGAEAAEQRRALVQALTLLTERERQVLRGVLAGGTSRTIAGDLGLQPKSVEIYRGHVLGKLGFSSSLEMVRAILSAGVDVDEPPGAERSP